MRQTICCGPCPFDSPMLQAKKEFFSPKLQNKYMHICIHVEMKYIIYMYIRALHCWFAVGLVLAYSFLIRVGGGSCWPSSCIGKNGLILQESEVVFFFLIPEHLLVAEMHNATHLKSWGEHYITVHYEEIIEHNRTALQLLPVKTARALEAHRWPPVWYLMENEWYKRTVGENEVVRKLQQRRRWYQSRN